MKENSIKDQSLSSCLMGKSLNVRGDNPKLQDFIIKKVIDKGSFGKVFLVENKTDGRLFAMKRLNKD